MSLIVFSMINLVGDPVDMLVNPESLPEEIDRVRQAFGLDQPVHIQYWKFLTGALSGDLGNSFIFGRPALALIAERFPATLELATCALVFRNLGCVVPQQDFRISATCICEPATCIWHSAICTPALRFLPFVGSRSAF